MRCPKCNSDGIRAYITIQMYIDADDNHHLTKKVINKKSTEIWGQSHDKTSYVCINKDCLYRWGYGYDYIIKDGKIVKI